MAFIHAETSTGALQPPITLSPRAVEVLQSRQRPCVSWYLDLKLIHEYWNGSHRYHHTTPVNMLYALREALRMIHQETLQERFARHRVNHLALVAGLEALDLAMHVEPAHRLRTLNTPRLPEGVDDAALRKALMDRFGIEVLGGFGPLAGKPLRIGLMGSSSTRNNVLFFLGALETCLSSMGYDARGGLQAAEAVCARQQSASAG